MQTDRLSEPKRPSKMPMTRPVSLTIHEPMFMPMLALADLKCDGSVSELLRLLLYAELLKEGIITTDDILRLG